MQACNKKTSKGYMSQEAISELVVKYQKNGCQRSLALIVEGHMDLCNKIAKRYAKRFSHEDCVQDCAESLIRSVKSFDISRSESFTLYAKVLMSSALQLKAMQQWNIVCTPSTKDFLKAFRRMGRLPFADHMSPKSAQYIADDAGVNISYVYGAYALYSSSVSLNQPIGDEEMGATMLDVMKSNGGKGPEDIIIEHDYQTKSYKKLNKALDKLDPRHATVISMRRLQEKPVVLREIAAQLRVSGERIRQMEVEAMSCLKEEMMSSHY